MSKEAPHDCFWTGGFVRYAAVFITGVMVTLMLFGIAVHDVVQTERSLGECDVACDMRGYDLSTVYDNARCRCIKIGDPDNGVVIDPHEGPRCSLTAP